MRMDMNLLRQQIRQILAEEISQLATHDSKAAAPTRREETVRIQSDADLNDFVQRLLDIGKDGQSRAEILAGRWIFRLDRVGRGASIAVNAGSPERTSGQIVSFERGLITEGQIAKMQQGATLVVAKGVSLTPLARDEARRKQINIQRAPT